MADEKKITPTKPVVIPKQNPHPDIKKWKNSEPKPDEKEGANPIIRPNKK